MSRRSIGQPDDFAAGAATRLGWVGPPLLRYDGGTYGISRKCTSLASFSANWPGPDNIARIVPEVRACSRFTTNSWPSEEISFTYMASGPSHPP